MLQSRLGEVTSGRRLLEQSFRTILRAYGPNHENTLEIRKNLPLTLVMAKRYNEAIPHLREIVRGDVSSNLRVDLKDPSFAGMRSLTERS